MNTKNSGLCPWVVPAVILMSAHAIVTPCAHAQGRSSVMTALPHTEQGRLQPMSVKSKDWDAPPLSAPPPPGLMFGATTPSTPALWPHTRLEAWPETGEPGERWPRTGDVLNRLPVRRVLGVDPTGSGDLFPAPAHAERHHPAGMESRGSLVPPGQPPVVPGPATGVLLMLASAVACRRRR